MSELPSDQIHGRSFLRGAFPSFPSLRRARGGWKDELPSNNAALQQGLALFPPTVLVNTWAFPNSKEHSWLTKVSMTGSFREQFA